MYSINLLQAQSPVATIGDYTASLSEKTEKHVLSSDLSNITYRIPVGEQVQRAINNFNAFFVQYLHNEYGNMVTADSARLEKLSRMVSAYESDALKNQDSLEKAVTAYIAELGMDESTPILNGVDRQFFIVPYYGKDPEFDIEGNFGMESFGRDVPKLHVADTVRDLESFTSETITFKMPRGRLAKLTKSSELVIVPLKVTIPFRTTRFWFIHKYHTVVHQRYFVLLPNSPGEVTFQDKTSKEWTTTVTRRTQPVVQHSSARDLVKTHCASVPNDPNVVKSSIHLVMDNVRGKEGVDWITKRQDEGGKVCYMVETFFNKFGESGSVTFHFVYDKRMTETDVTTKEEFLQMDWGDRKNYRAISDEWKLTFRAFTGEVFEFSDASDSNPFVQVLEKDGIIKVRSTNIKDFRWPPQ